MNILKNDFCTQKIKITTTIIYIIMLVVVSDTLNILNVNLSKTFKRDT